MIVAKGVGKRQKVWIEATQKRVSATSDILNGIKTIKMTGLTERSSDFMAELRKGEIAASKQWRQLQLFMLGIGQKATPFLQFRS